MTREGVIPINNAHGMPCPVHYYYDQALDDYFLVPNKHFAAADVLRVKRVMPNLVKAMILNQIADRTSNNDPETGLPTYAPVPDRPTCSLSGGR